MKEDIIMEIKLFLKALQDAEAEGQNEFTCPLCGGQAVWTRSQYNDHVHCGCKRCGFHMME